MSEQSIPARAPVDLWIIGVVGVLWNAYGCFDYLMTQMRSETYLASLAPEQVAMIMQMPLWANVAWAVGVWGGLLGCVVLLLRRRMVVHALRLSLLGAAIGMAYQIRHMPQPIHSSVWVLTMTVLAVCLALVLYARWLILRGVLR